MVIGVVGIYQELGYFLHLTATSGVFWSALPLAIATLAIVFYFSKYNNESFGWNSLFGNSLILLFVSVDLLRYIYGINSTGLVNFIDLPVKTVIAFVVLIGGIVMMSVNFEHLLPEKVANHISAPWTLNVIAYCLMLFIYSDESASWNEIFALVIILIVLLVFFNVLRILLIRTFNYLKKLKEKEEVENVVEEKKRIETEKKEIKNEEKEFKKSKIKEIVEEQKEARKIKKVLRK